MVVEGEEEEQKVPVEEEKEKVWWRWRWRREVWESNFFLKKIKVMEATWSYMIILIFLSQSLMLHDQHNIIRTLNMKLFLVK